MIDFSRARPAEMIASRKSNAASEHSLFEFEVVEIVGSGLQKSPRAVSRLNDRMALASGVFLFLIPIPYGANRPLIWVAASVLLGLTALGYFLLLSIFDPNRPSQLKNYWTVLFTGSLAILFAAFQLAPITLNPPAILSEFIASTGITLSKTATLIGIQRLISYGLLFILVSEICTTTARTERLLRWTFFGISAHAIWALISLSLLGDTLLFQAKTDYLGFATGTFVNRNSFATYMGMGAIIGATLVTFETRTAALQSSIHGATFRGLKDSTALNAVLLFLIISALVASASRLGLVSTLVGLWVSISVVLLRTGMSKTKAASLSVAVAFLGFGVFLFTSNQEILRRFVYLFVDSESRVELFRQTLKMIMTRPLTGFGLDSYPIAFEIFHTPELSTSLIWDKPHNTYLTLWSELGLIGGSFPIAAVLIAFALLVRSARTREQSYFPATAAMGVVVLGALHSLGDFSLEMAANTYVFVAIVAMGLAHRGRSR